MEYFETIKEKPNLKLLGLKKPKEVGNGTLYFKGTPLNNYVDKPYLMLKKVMFKLISMNIGYTVTNLKLRRV